MRVFICIVCLIVATSVSACAETLYKNDSTNMSVSTFKNNPPTYRWDMLDFKCIATFIGHSLLQVVCENGERIFMYKEEDVIVVGYTGKTIRYSLGSPLSDMYIASFNHANKVVK